MDDELPTKPQNEIEPSAKDEPVWLVSYADDDDRELSASEIAKALSNGEIVLTTIVWRDGMSDWKPIVEVPELRSVVQKQRVARKRSTVMGGFGTPPPPPGRGAKKAAPPEAAPPPARSPRPRTAAHTPGPPAAAPSPPRPAAKRGSPKGTLLGGTAPAAAAPPPAAPAPPDDSEPESLEDLGSAVLESVPGEDLVETAVRGVDGERSTLTGTGASEPPDSDSEPISLIPESVDSVPSGALESIVEQTPPARRGASTAEAEQPKQPGIFDIDLNAPSEDTEVDVETTRPRPPQRANVGHITRSSNDAPPSIRVFAPEAEAAEPAPRPPAPRRQVQAPLPQDPLDGLEEDELTQAPKKKKGGFGKFMLVALVVGVCAAAFYLGRQSAEPIGPDQVAVNEPTVPAADSVAATQASEAPTAADSAEESAEEEAEAEPEETDEAEEEESDPAEDESAEPGPARGATRAAVAHRPAPRPRDRPSVAEKSPAPTPKEESEKQPATAEPKEPETEEEEPKAVGPFDRNAAAAALNSAAAGASSCRKAGDPSGVAQVSVSFSTSGRATRAIVQGPPFAGTQTGGCIAAKMRGARIPPFTGSRVTVKKRVVIQ